MSVLDRLIESQNLRQAALDLLHANPQGLITTEIIKLLGWKTGSSGGSRLQKMAAEGEVRAVPEFIQVKNGSKTRQQKVWRYFALVETTKQADHVFGNLGFNLSAAGRAESAGKPVRKSKPGHYIHNDADRPCIKNQGGQGSLKAPRTATYMELNA